MAVYFFDKDQTLIKIVPKSGTTEITQTRELPVDDSLMKDTLVVTAVADEKLLDAEYMAVSTVDDNAQSFDMYRIIDDTTPDTTMTFTGMQLGVYELEGKIIQDIRPNNHSVGFTVERLLSGTDWRLGYVADGLPNFTTNFYYISAKEALKSIQALTGAEFVFKVEISGNQITDKWVEVYREMGNRTQKRFNYGTNALTVVRETNKAEVYTALIGRGKGEEVSGADDNASGQAGYGRKITFKDVAWSKSNGDPLDKPAGQNYLEYPEMTEVFGMKTIDGSMIPRIGVVDFDDEEDPENLLRLTYEQLIESSRPRVLFKTTVANIGETGIGDTVSIHRHDLNIHYQTRVRKVVRNRLNDNKTQIELGDVVFTPSTQRTKNITNSVKNLARDITDTQIVVSETRLTADQKNNVTWGNVEPERKRTGDLWYREHPSITGETQMLIWNGDNWELVLDSSDTNKVAREVQRQTAKLNAFTEEIEAVRDKADEAIESAGGVASLADRHGELINNLRADADSALANAGRALDNITDLSQSAQLRFQELSEELDLKADWDALAEMDRALKEDIEEAQANARELVQDLDRTLTEDIQEAQSNARELVETAEDRLDRAINLKADQEALESLDQSVNREFEALDDRLSLKASQITVDSLSDTVTVQKNRLDHTIEGLAFKADREDVDTLERTVTEQGNRITVNEQGLTQKADRSVVDDLNQTVEQQGLELRSTSEGLALKADRSTVNNLSGRVSTAENNIKINADEINRRLTRSEVDNLVDGRNFATQSYVSNSVKETADGINRTIESVERNVSGIRDDFDNMQVGGRNYLLDTEGVREFRGNVILWVLSPKKLDLNGREATVTFYARHKEGSDPVPLHAYYRQSDSTNLGHSYTDKYTTTEWQFFSIPIEERFIPDDLTDYVTMAIRKPDATNIVEIRNVMLSAGNVGLDWRPAPEDLATVSQVNDIESTVTRHSTQIEATSQGLELKADQSTVNTLTGRVDTAENRITANANEISRRLTRSEVDNLVDGRNFATQSYVSNSVRETADGLNQLISSVRTTANGAVQRSSSDYQSLLQTSRLYERVLGTTQSNIESNISRVVQTSGIIQQEVEALERGLSTRITQTEDSISLMSRKVTDFHPNLVTNSTEPKSWERSSRSGYNYVYRWELEGVIPQGNGIRVKLEGAIPANRNMTVVMGDTNGSSGFWENPSWSSGNILRLTSNFRDVTGFIELHTNWLTTFDRITVIESDTTEDFEWRPALSDGVIKNDLISEINIQADRQIFRVGDGRLMLTQDTTYINNNLITNRMLASGITADKITTGTLDASRARIINLDVNSLTGNLTNFVQTNWNGIYSSIQMRSDGMSISDPNGNLTKLANGTLEFYYRGKFLGYIGSSIINEERTRVGGVSINLEHDEGFMLAKKSSRDSGFQEVMQVRPHERNVRMNALLDMNHNINLSGYGLLRVNRMEMDYGSSRITGWGTRGISIEPQNNLRIVTWGSTAAEFLGSRIHFLRELNMNGNSIRNNSDRRLKRDIQPTEIDSLSAISRWTFVDYNWIDETLNSRQGRQLGLIAQDTPEIADYDSYDDTWNINSSKQIMMNTHAIQQLANESNNKFKTQEDQIFELQQELSKANRRIKELEEAK